MNYQAAVEFLFSRLPMFHRVGAAAYKADLTNTIALLKHLGNPESKFKSVHIAGTNGKGSVSHMIASVFQQAGYKTGLFTSPHLTDYRERIKINGDLIPESYVSSFVDRYQNLVDEIQPSFFEYTTGLAFSYFAEQQVDIAVIETGMGGRLDSTNVIQPEISVITNIGMDHMQFLGDTLQKIAIEKAGIIKPGVPVIIGETQEETCAVFTMKAEILNSPILFADQAYHAEFEETAKNDADYVALNVTLNNQVYLSKLQSPLLGAYQVKNMITAIAAIDRLRLAGYHISLNDIHEGIRRCVINTGLRGRWQIIGRAPLTICDVGHNVDGLKYVIDQINHTIHKDLHLVFGCVEDKDVDAILDLLPENARYYFCKADIPRGMNAEKLAGIARGHGLHGEAYNSVNEAFNKAKSEAAEDDLVVVTGSFFVVAEVLKSVECRV